MLELAMKRETDHERRGGMSMAREKGRCAKRGRLYVGVHEDGTAGEMEERSVYTRGRETH